MINYTHLSRKDAFFICANSGFGFVSHTDDFFKDCTRLYILKGGPGTGKSRFMEELANAAEKEGHKVLKILCSSDPNSLDGIMIPSLHIGVTDGTAPHITEPALPGAREQLLDPGAFWDRQALFEKRQEIQTLVNEKKHFYTGALSFLSGAKQVFFCQQTILKPALDERKIARILKKMQEHTKRSKGATSTRFLSAIGMRGAVTLDGYDKQAEKIYTILPYFGAEKILLLRLKEELSKKEEAFFLFNDPVSLFPEGIYLEECATLFRCGAPLSSKTEQVIDSKKILKPCPKEDKKTLRLLEKQQEELINGSFLMFSKMKDCHFSLEALYGQSMDFAALEDFKAKEISKILHQEP